MQDQPQYQFGAYVYNQYRRSTDGGTSWSLPILAPKEMKGVSALSWMEYDPVHDALYIMKMSSELFQWKR